MKKIDIKTKLTNMGIDLASINMGEFDYLGEFTAKRDRKRTDENFQKYGAFYRSNYERGILIYYLIRQHTLNNVVEIGFGRGYSTLCAATAFYESGIEGRVISVDPNFDEKFLQALTQVVNPDLFKYINLVKGTSHQVLPTMSDDFDLIYIDGDHSYEGTKHDWNWAKDRNAKFILMDDYHLPEKNDPGIQCRTAIDEIDWDFLGFEEPELIITDRRMFHDDRNIKDSDVNYGQVLFTRKNQSDNPIW